MSFCIFHSCFVLWRRTFDISKRRTISLTNLTRSFALCEKGQRKMERLCATSVGASVAFHELAHRKLWDWRSTQHNMFLDTTTYQCYSACNGRIQKATSAKSFQLQSVAILRHKLEWPLISLSLSCSMYNIYIWYSPHQRRHVRQSMTSMHGAFCFGLGEKFSVKWNSLSFVFSLCVLQPSD